MQQRSGFLQVKKSLRQRDQHQSGQDKQDKGIFQADQVGQVAHQRRHAQPQEAPADRHAEREQDGHAQRGDAGFGYDPLFYVADEGCSAAELTGERKNELSHRGQALRAMLPEIARVLAAERDVR